jgi:hypothetical protein
MNDKHKNKMLMYVPPYMLSLIGIAAGICIASFTDKSGTAALVIIFSILAGVVLTCVLETIFKD